MGEVQDVNGNLVILSAGQPYAGPQPNSALQDNFATATLGGQTAQVISAGFGPGSYGMYQLEIIVPTGLTANPATQLYVAQNAFISNTVTLPVGTPTLNPPPPVIQPPPSTTPIRITIDSPQAAGSPMSGVATLAGWAIDNDNGDYGSHFRSGRRVSGRRLLRRFATGCVRRLPRTRRLSECGLERQP